MIYHKIYLFPCITEYTHNPTPSLHAYVRTTPLSLKKLTNKCCPQNNKNSRKKLLFATAATIAIAAATSSSYKQ
jgi:hypothetical protein